VTSAGNDAAAKPAGNDVAGPLRQAGPWTLYIDSEGDFYPPAAARVGVPLDRLLILRVRRSADALWACEQALRCRAVGVVILPIRRLEAAHSRRLQLAAEVGGGLGFLLRPDEDGPPTFSATRLRIEPQGCTASLMPAAGCERDRLVPPDADRILWPLRITCLKLRNGLPGQVIELTLSETCRAMWG